jgi:hypothetical protein
MHHIIYLSQAKTGLTSSELVFILRQARENNQRQNVTGALVYGRGQFMQILEGEEEVIIDIYQKIASDSRHFEAFKLADKPIQRRSFQGWSMAFAELTPSQFDQLTGYTAPTEFEQQESIGSMIDDLLLERMKELMRPV